MAEEMTRCGGCGYETAQSIGRCPQCGRAVHSPGSVRLRGWAQLLLGVLLVGMMGAVTFNLAPMLARAGEPADGIGARFTGTPEQARFIMWLFGLVLAFGLGSVAAGLWQIATGRNNKWIIAAMLGLFVVLMLAARLTTGSLRG